MGRVGLDQHTSTIFNPRLNLKKHPFGTVQSLKMLEKGTLTIDKNQQHLLHTIAFSTFRLLNYDESSQFPPPPSKFRTPLQIWEVLMY